MAMRVLGGEEEEEGHVMSESDNVSCGGRIDLVGESGEFFFFFLGPPLFLYVLHLSFTFLCYVVFDMGRVLSLCFVSGSGTCNMMCADAVLW